MKALLWIVAAVVCLLAGFVMGRQHRPPAVYTDTVTYVDTQRVAYPVPRDSTVIRYITVTLPAVSDTTGPDPIAPDTCTVQLPVTQKVYRDSNYMAVVEGYRPRLISIELYPKTTTITKTITKTRSPRWALTAGPGVGFGPNGVQPYIGVTVGFVLWGK